MNELFKDKYIRLAFIIFIVAILLSALIVGIAEAQDPDVSMCNGSGHGSAGWWAVVDTCGEDAELVEVAYEVYVNGELVDIDLDTTNVTEWTAHENHVLIVWAAFWADGSGVFNDGGTIAIDYTYPTAVYLPVVTR